MAEKTILDVLTMDEIEQLEKTTQLTINDLFAKGNFPGRALKIIVFLLRKRTNPDAKIEDVGQLTFTEATQEIQDFLDSPKAD